jgi:hypothetical protein
MKKEYRDFGLSVLFYWACWAFLVIVILSSTSCGIGTVAWSLKDPKFQEENQPIRTVRLVVLSDGSNDKAGVERIIESVSEDLIREVGIRLEMMKWIESRWESTSRFKILQEMKENQEINRIPWDIAIAPTRNDPVSVILAQTIGGILAVTDDFYRRYIISYELSPHILKHEIIHCFVFKEGHALSGIEFPAMIRLLPFTPTIAIGGSSLTPGMRQEVLANKWRNFEEIPTGIPKKHQKDIPKIWKDAEAIR